MVSQKEAHLTILGDLWFERNKDDMGKQDPVLDLMGMTIKEIKGSVLEIGCANGWRLKAIQEKYGCEVYGLEPSGRARAQAVIPSHYIMPGTADDIHYEDGAFDGVIFGFCLYLVDPSLWFKVAHESLRVLRDGGFLLIYDKISARPHKRLNPYPQYKGEETYMYFQDWSKFFTVHPGIKSVAESMFFHEADMEAVTLLRKTYQI